MPEWDMNAARTLMGKYYGDDSNKFRACVDMLNPGPPEVVADGKKCGDFYNCFYGWLVGDSTADTGANNFGLCWHHERRHIVEAAWGLVHGE